MKKFIYTKNMRVYFVSIVGSIIAMGFTLSDLNADIELYNNANIEIDNANYLTLDEKTMLKEINLVRVYPQKYLVFIEELLDETRADSIRLSSMVSESIKKRVVYEDFGEVVTIDTIRNNYYDSRISAINELIDELGQAKPLRALKPSETMYVSAKNHGTEQSVHNYIDHHGGGGTWPMDRLKKDSPWISAGNENIASGIGSPRDMVIQFIVDSGVKKRGHRKNILHPAWTHFTCYNVKELNKEDYKWWIQEFAY